MAKETDQLDLDTGPRPSSPRSRLRGILTSMSGDVIHHLYRHPGDLLPYCGATPGRDLFTGDWHTGHDEELLIEACDFGLAVCSVCLSPDALGGWSPLYLSGADGNGDEDGALG